MDKVFTPTTTRSGINSDKLSTRVLLPEDIDEYWPYLQPMLISGLPASEQEFNVDDLYRGLKAGDLHAFVVLTSSGFTKLLAIVEVGQFPRYRVARVVMLVGEDFRSSSQFFQSFENWALVMGAVQIEGWVKPAQKRLFQRIVPELKDVYTVVRKSLRGRLQ